MKPAIPQTIIITIGLILYFRVPTKATGEDDATDDKRVHIFFR